MDQIKLKKKISELSKGDGKWNHYYNFNGVETRPLSKELGDNTVKWRRINELLKNTYKNKIILDIGCSDGLFSNEIAKLNAKKVYGIDLNKIRIKRAKFASKILNIKSTNFSVKNFYDIEVSNRQYDLVIALGILHRVPEIYKFIERCSQISNQLLIEFKTLDHKDPVCEFIGTNKKKYGMKSFFYFAPSISFVTKVLEYFNFKKIEVLKDNLSNLKYKRTVILGSKK
jgi:ubiquinone/menaquinone biosynthesis C-methylase UbiE